MAKEESFLTTLHVDLRDKNNGTYRGQLLLKNWTMWQGDDGSLYTDPNQQPIPTDEETDESGAGYFVIAVVLVYGMSIVMLIASHINRKHTKLVEDRQIHKYLQEFQIVKERSSQEAYKDLKRKIKEQIKWEKEHKGKQLSKSLSHAIMPMIAVTLPAESLTNLGIVGTGSHHDIANSRCSSLSRLSCPSSPSSVPRSRSSSVSSAPGVHKNNRNNFLHPDDAHELMNALTPLRGMPRTRRKGVVSHFGNHNHHHVPGMDAHHLEKILEESMDNRGSFSRRGSRRSKRSSHSSHTSVPEALKRLVSNELNDVPSCHSAEELENENQDTVITNNGVASISPDSGLSNHSPETINPPDITMDMCGDEGQPLYQQTDTHIDIDYLPHNNAHDDASVWVLNSDFTTDDEELRDEAYVSGHHISGFSSSVPLPQVHAFTNNSAYTSERGLANGRKPRAAAPYTDYYGSLIPRLSPLQDESEMESDSSSDESGDELLHVTCV